MRDAANSHERLLRLQIRLVRGFGENGTNLPRVVPDVGYLSVVATAGKSLATCGAIAAPSTTRQPVSSTIAVEDIDHSRTKTKNPQRNGICERFHKTVPNEFYRIAFRKKLHRGERRSPERHLAASEITSPLSMAPMRGLGLVPRW